MEPDRDPPPALLSLTPQELAERLAGPGRAKAVYHLLRQGQDPFQAGQLGPRAQQRLQASASPTHLTVDGLSTAEDGTLKLRLRLSDDRQVEAVLIPSNGRTTLCVSTQVGCARACGFCFTGLMGLVRNLTCAEIAAQLVLARRTVAARKLAPLRNLVLMGMGEPLDNLQELGPALRLITAEDGLALGRRHVTLSTVGPSPEAVRAAGQLPAHLAWSLHAADDALRRRLVPTTRHSVGALRDAFAEVATATRDPLFVELTLIDGVNDRPVDADAVIALFRGFPSEVRLNLLPMNPVPGSGYAPSRPEQVERFHRRLFEAGYRALVRRARGDDQDAACGQLAVLGQRTSRGMEHSR